MEGDSRKYFYLAMGSMVLSKSLAISAPYCLKIAVNALTAATVNFNLAAMGIIGFGAARAMSSYFHEIRMTLVVGIIREAIQKLSM